jgi:hypothetical protein
MPFARAGVATPVGFGAQQFEGVFAAGAPLFAEFGNEARMPLAPPFYGAVMQAWQRLFGNLSADPHPFWLPGSSFLSQQVWVGEAVKVS